jgi:hypothetical protein
MGPAEMNGNATGYLVNTAENSALLFVVFFSPGTGSTSAVIVTAAPNGGA